MYTRFTISNIKSYRGLFIEVMLVTVYSAIIYILYDIFGQHEIAISFSVSAIMGTAISILLGFRTSAAYERWWEARKIWGGIVNDSRSIVRQSLGFFQPGEDKKGNILHLSQYQIAWCYSLSTSLRGLPLADEVKRYLSEKDYTTAINQSNVPNGILSLMETHLADMFRTGKIDTYQFAAMDKTMKALCDHMGKCERIKNTVFPVHYSFFIRLSVIIFALLLPLELIEFLGIYTIPIAFATISFIGVIELIANYLQDPFENRAADIGMTSLCRTIEVNLLQMSGEQEVPQLLEPDNKGIVM